MIFGMTIFTFVHVLISLAAIATGPVVTAGLLKSERMDAMTTAYLVFTAATNITGFMFLAGNTPAFKLGIISSVVLVVCAVARYGFAMRGAWRPTYALSAVTLLYFNVFVLIVQSFQKIAPLHALAPKGTELPFAAAQVVVLAAFVVTGVISALRFRPS